MTAPDPELIQRLLELDERRTPGEWYQEDYSVRHHHKSHRRSPPVAKCNLTHGIGQAALDDLNNAAFIAAAPQMAAQLRALMTERDRMRKALERIVHPRDHGCAPQYCDCNTPDSLQIYIDGLKEIAINALRGKP